MKSGAVTVRWDQLRRNELGAPIQVSGRTEQIQIVAGSTARQYD